MGIDIFTRAFFRFTFSVYPAPDELKIDGSLNGWTKKHLLHDVSDLDDTPSFADLYTGWKDDGLYFAVNARGKKEVVCNERKRNMCDAVDLWLDTRDIKQNHRASRFCHQYYLKPFNKERTGKPVIKQLKIGRAKEHAPIYTIKDFKLAMGTHDDGYTLEWYFPARTLNGYDPASFRKIGFAYRVTDHEHGNQVLPMHYPFPFMRDPSLWVSLELVD
jgi:hypothetical protein